jgi:hypothetical protein
MINDQAKSAANPGVVKGILNKTGKKYSGMAGFGKNRPVPCVAQDKDAVLCTFCYAANRIAAPGTRRFRHDSRCPVCSRQGFGSLALFVQSPQNAIRGLDERNFSAAECFRI